MKNKELIARLSELPGDADIDLLIENTAQWQFPVNGAAYSKAQNTIILMHEKWTGSESDENKEFKAYLYDDGGGEILNEKYPSPFADKDITLLREVDPAFDALVLEMVEALGRFDRNIAARHEATDILAKYDAYLKDREG